MFVNPSYLGHFRKKLLDYPTTSRNFSKTQEGCPTQIMGLITNNISLFALATRKCRDKFFSYLIHNCAFLCLELTLNKGLFP